MQNSLFLSPQKSQKHKLFQKLNLQYESQILIEDFIDQQRFCQLKDQKFQDLSENQQILCAIFILYFQNKIKELQNNDLSYIVDKVFSFEKKCEEIKMTFKIIRDLKHQQEINIPNFFKVHNTIGYFGILFATFKKIQKKFKIEFQSDQFKQIWIVLVLVAKKYDKQKPLDLQQLLDLMSALLLMQLQKHNTAEQFEAKRKLLADYSFELNDQELQKYKQEILSIVPDIDSPFFDCQESIQQFLNLKEKYDVNYLMFLEQDMSQNSKRNALLTPIVANSHCTQNLNHDRKSNIFKNSPLQNVSLDTNFNEIQMVWKSQSQQFLSPTLKKLFDETDRTLDLPKMLQWHKNIIKNIVLKNVQVETINYPIATQCIDMLDHVKIRQNYFKILNIVKNVRKDLNSIIKLFFALLIQFVRNEMVRSRKDQIYEVLKDSEFMLSLFCFSLSINSLITKNNKKQIQEYISLCQISFFNFWKILSLFAKNLSYNLPIIIRSRIVELEHLILLKLIWQTNKNSKNEADQILKQAGIQDQIAVKKLLSILIERICLISQKINLCPLHVQKVWQFITFLLKEHTKNKENRLENVHLDQIIILTINHIRIANMIYGGLGQILQVYNQNCLFPILNLSKEALVQYYKYDFQNLLKKSSHIDFKIKKQRLKNENPNSTPIRNIIKRVPKQVQPQSIFQGLEIKLEKRSQSDNEGNTQNRKQSLQAIKNFFQLQGQNKNDNPPNQNIKLNDDLTSFSKLGEDHADDQFMPTANITLNTPLFSDYNFSPEVKKSGQKTPTF